MSCAALLARTPNPSDDEIVAAMNGTFAARTYRARQRSRVAPRRPLDENARGAK